MRTGRALRAAVAALAAVLAGCAARPPGPDAFAFAVIGDAPYEDRELPLFDAMLAGLAPEPLAFVVHVGDFKRGSGPPCTDALYADRRARLDASPHPLVYTPGDNDWTDCRREASGRADPLERLRRLREIFFADAFSLGRVRMPVAVQDGCAARDGAACRCPGLPENRLWTKRGVVFATVHRVGSNDGRGFDAAGDAEQRCREAAGRAWIERALRLAESPGMRGLALFTQADPWVKSRDGAYDGLLAQVAAGARRLAKPVLFVHGDTHEYRADHPFVDGFGKPVENALRVESFGSPQVGWVRVTVDPEDPALFRAEPHGPPAAAGG